MENTQTYLSKEELEEFRKLLLEEKNKILKILAAEEELFMNQEEPDEIDLADIVINNSLLNKLSDLDLEKLRLIDRALEKIDLGTYGICEGTGNPIPKERLKAIPWTPYTVEYAESLNKKKKRK